MDRHNPVTYINKSQDGIGVSSWEAYVFHNDNRIKFHTLERYRYNLAELSAVLTLLLKIPQNQAGLQIDAHPTVTDDAFLEFIVLLFHPHVNIKVVMSVGIVIAV